MAARAVRLALLAAAWAALRFATLPDVTLCLWRALTGLPCPLCGLTRAFAALARGDLPAALAAHALSPLAALLALALVWAGPESLAPWWRALALVFGAFGVLRLLALTL